MKVFRNLDEIAQYFDMRIWEVERIYSEQFYRGIFFINGIDINIHIKDNKFNYVIFEATDEDCKEYILSYGKYEYDWRVYVDSIEGWQPCKVIDVSNARLEINRATVVTPAGTQLNRICKYALDEEDLAEDGCIYFLDKN